MRRLAALAALLSLMFASVGVPAASATSVNNPPVIDDQSFSVVENSPAGTVVGTVAAFDPDPGDSLSYAITAGNPGAAFAIDPNTGEINVADTSQVDFETTPSFALTVEVTDTGFLTDTATITINLNDLNEAPVVNHQSFSANENSAVGTAVGTVAAFDPDPGDSLSYAITAGNRGGAFAIDPLTGAITVMNAAALDFETTPSFTLTVEVGDSGFLSVTAFITVDLNDFCEAPAIDDQSFSVDENSATGMVVGVVVATDQDLGDSLSYAITAGNRGGAYAIDPLTGALTVANSAALDFETTPSFTLTVEVEDSETLTDTATITINLNDLNEGSPDYSVTKDDALATAQPGDAVAYTITVDNTGNQDGTGVVVADAFPTSVLTNVTASGGGVVDPLLGTVNWNLGGLAAGGSVTLTVTADVLDPVGAGIDDFTNTVSVTDDLTNGPDPTPADNTDSDTDSLDAAPDYSVTKDDALATAQPGDAVAYTITVDNTGNQDGTGVVVADAFPTSVLTNVTASGGGVVDPLLGTVNWNLGGLAAGGSVTLTVTADVLDPVGAGIDDFTNTVSVTDDLTNGPDPTPADNTDSDTDSLDAAPDYSVTKDDALATAQPGDAVAYTITVDNTGNQDGTGVVVADAFPTSVLTNVTASGGGVVDPLLGTVNWNLGGLAAGGSVTLTVTADVLDPVGAGIDDFTNTVSVTDDLTNGPDPTPADNTDSDTDSLDAAPDYSVTKDDALATAQPGDAVAYTITVDNTGNQDGTGVVVADAFPTSVLTNVTASGGGVVDPLLGTVNWNLGGLAAGGSVTLTVTADVLDPVGAGIDDFTNTVSVTDDLTNGPDPTPADNTDSDTDSLDAAPDYSVTKDDALATAQPGDAVAYTITVDNTGNQDGTGVVVADAFPTSVLTNVTASGGGVVDPLLGTVNWNLGGLAAGGSVTLTVTADVLDPVGAGIDDFTNTVSVTDDLTNGPDPTPADNTDSDTDSLDAAPDYTITKDDGMAEVARGTSITYTITVDNFGNQDGTGVTVSDAFPTNVLTNVTASNGGIADPLLGTIGWNLGALAAGGSVTLTVTADVRVLVGAGIDTVTNTVSVTDDGANGPDPTPADNTDTDTNTLLPPTPRVGKEAAAETLAALIPSGDVHNDKHLEKALERLGKSLDPERWVDESHVTTDKVFNDERKAARELEKVLYHGASDTVVDGIEGILGLLIEADRILAETALDDAVRRGGDPKKTAKALGELAEAELAEGDVDKAIKHFGKAWNEATKA